MNELDDSELRLLEILKRKIALLDRVIQFNQKDNYFVPMRAKTFSARYSLALMEKGEKEVFEFSKQLEKQFLLNPLYSFEFLGIPYLSYKGKLNYLKEVVDDLYNNLLNYPEKWINLGNIIVKKKNMMGIKTWKDHSCDINLETASLRLQKQDNIQYSLKLEDYKLQWQGKGKEKFKFLLTPLDQKSKTINSEDPKKELVLIELVLGSLKEHEAINIFTVLNLFTQRGDQLKTTIYKPEELNAQASLEQRRIFFLSASKNFLLNLLTRESLYSSFASGSSAFSYRFSDRKGNSEISRKSGVVEFEKIFTTAGDLENMEVQDEYRNFDVLDSFQMVSGIEESNFIDDGSPVRARVLEEKQIDSQSQNSATQQLEKIIKEELGVQIPQQYDHKSNTLEPIGEATEISEASSSIYVNSRQSTHNIIGSTQLVLESSKIIEQEINGTSYLEDIKQDDDEDVKKKNNQIQLSPTLIECDDELPFEILIQFQSKGGSQGKGTTKTNQDCVCQLDNFTGKKERTLIGVFDGHGPQGHNISNYVREKLVTNLESVLKSVHRQKMTHQQYFLKTIIRSQKSFLKTQQEILENLQQESKMSGSTALTIFIDGSNIFCFNLGDSRAIMVQKNIHFDQTHKEGINSQEFIAQLLSREQRPNNFYEYLRIISNGGLVLQENQSSPFRVVHPEHGFGLLMSRSFGDQLMNEVGVVSLPEISCHQITENDRFMIIGSDGLWEHFTNYQFINMVLPFYQKRDLKGAIQLLIKETSQTWYERERRIDDISIVLVFFYQKSEFPLFSN